MTDSSADRAVAIVGVGAILPDAPNAPAFWENIVNRRYSITEVPPERWSIADYYDPDPKAPDKTYSKIGGWVRGFQFDWKRYRMPPKVTAAMDQGQQWAVTIAAEALADYGYPERPLNTERTAVILGTAMGGELHYLTHLRVAFPEFAHALEGVSEFSQLPPDLRSVILSRWHEIIDQQLPPITEDSMPGELPNIVSGRVANLLDLHGPNFIADAACASSFAAINAAIEMLTQHHVDAVIAGGVDRNMGASTFVKFCKIGALSPTGSRPFADGADGFVMGEGSASFLLKRLADAERSGDRIYAVIRGIGGGSDGKGKGITAPNPIGQQFAMQRAWENAGLDPATASYVEAHGTSTRVGDVVEVESLTKIYGGAKPGSIGLGSVKSNIGHLKAGAGAAGLLKATMAIYHRVLPPTLNAEKPNPNIDFRQTPFCLFHEAREWPNGKPRRAGVSAYGFGGTNFHVVIEEHVPGLLTQPKRYAGVEVPTPSTGTPQHSKPAAPPRGILALGASTPKELKDKIDATFARVQTGWTPPFALPSASELSFPERVVIDFGNHEELLQRLQIAQKAAGFDTVHSWKPFQAQGIFRGSGKKPGKLAFLFPGQGSQYVNMGKELAAFSPIVQDVFDEADRVMTPILGKPLTSYIFVDSSDPKAINQAEFSLMQTAITQPAMLTLDIALLRLLQAFGFNPDLVMGHSLGEYAALIAAGIMPFADALEAAAARGSEMSKVSMDDNGKMAAVLAPIDVVMETLKTVDGYVVPANINSKAQCVIGGASDAVEKAVAIFEEKGFKAMLLPVSHAFHTRIVAPASEPLRCVLDRLHITPPTLPLVANVTGELYPTTVEAIKDILQLQIASPVQWVKGLETLYAQGARTFVECGPKRALKGFVDDVFADKTDILSLLTSHPKNGELPSFNQALCGLYAAGYAVEEAEPAAPITQAEPKPKETEMASNNDLGQILAQAIQSAVERAVSSPTPRRYDRNDPPTGSVIISGTGLGLPGQNKPVMDENNALRILRGEQFVDLIPERFRKGILAKHITRLVKSEDGSGRFETITDPNEVIKLAGVGGSFSLSDEYGVPEKLIEALDITTQLAMAAGIDALREAGIPLVQTYRRASTGKYLPDRWMLPESLRDETGVIFASAFPGGDRYADEFKRYYTYQDRLNQLALLEDLQRYTEDTATLTEISRRISDLRGQIEREPYEFDRRFIFRVLAMGHSQFAEYIGARGPNTHVNQACASTAQAIALAEDWIRIGRCRRVIVIGADDVTSDNLMEWIGAGFLATGAAATDDRVEEAALPFDRRRHGTLLGMGACALVVESEDAVRERGMRGLVEILSSETRNSAYHGTRLNVEHISLVMNDLLTSAERRFGINRYAIAPQMVFMSHETFTPARGGSAAAEVMALRNTFGDAASDIVIANTKGFTGHPMGVGIEDVIAVKILEYGIVPPVPNYKEVDPDLGKLNLSRGGRYPVQYALHLSAGFGSQISMTLVRRIPGALDRVDNKPRYQRWLDDLSGCDHAETEVVKRNLRIRANSTPNRAPAPSNWQYGTGPIERATAPGDVSAMPPVVQRPVKHPVQPPKIETVVVKPAPVAPTPAPAAPAPVAVTPAPAAPAVDPVVEKVLEIVAAQTGYPQDMLDLDLDLEADLGVDTVKQAETFAAIRAAFDIPRLENLKLRDYPTLNHVIGFVRQHRPDLVQNAAPVAAAPVSAPAPVAPTPTSAAPAVDPVVEKVLEIVAAQTGYPQDMLDLDLDLEADLGVDTVKQAETFAAIRAAFDIPRLENLKLRDYPTLNHVIGFVRQHRPDLVQSIAPVAAAPVSAPAPVAPTPTSAAPAVDPVVEKVLEIVAAQTGYPQDMLDLDLDLEADLGVDTVKQAETFAAIRAAFDIPRLENLKLRDYPTLNHVIGFVRQHRPDLSNGNGATAVAISSDTPAAETKPLVQIGSIEDADRIPRRVPTPSLRPALDLCKPTGVTLDENSRVIVALDKGGVGTALVARLQKRGVTILTIESDISSEALEAQIKAWLEAGTIQGVYWLPALDVEPDIEEMDLETWRELNRQRVKNLYVTMRALYATIITSGNFLVTSTRLGGLHGYNAEGASAPLGGAVVGFTKAYKRERGDVLVKAVDFEINRKTAALADVLIAETLTDPGIVEVGYVDDERYAVTLVELPASDGGAGLTLDKETVFLVTGAAGGITSAIIGDLAGASGGIFYLLDLVAAPAPDDPRVALFRSDKDALKRKLIDDAKARGEKPTPAQIDKQVMNIEREEAALRAIEAVQAAGGTPYYYSINLLDGEACAKVIEDVRARHGRLDVLIHAGGLEISRSLADKDAAQFNLVFDVKADGFFNLLRAAKGLPIGTTVAFSSVAGRFGNNGQTDYSAANDLLCKITSSLRRWRPETRGIVIDWTAWGGIGMATRGSIPKIMEMAGIDMLPPESGIPTVRRELVAGSFRGEIVVGDRLGVLMQEWDAQGGIDTEKVNAQIDARKLLMLGSVKAANLYGGLEVETTLDPNEQPFLYDHQIDGTPVLPGVMGIEAFAEIASALAPGYTVAAVTNVQFNAPFKFYRCESATLYLSAFAQPMGNGELIAHAALRSVRELPNGTQQEKVHFTADVRLTRTPPGAPTVEFTPPASLELTADRIYRVHFHGPAYQVLECAEVTSATEAIALLRDKLPPNSRPEDAASLIAPRLIEFCFQTAGIWEMTAQHVMALPMSVESVTTYRQPEQAGRLYARVQAVEDGFNAQVIDETGVVYVSLNGYRTVKLPGNIDL
jgi:malonyl CoA-acyl carrier protein transacylase